MINNSLPNTSGECQAWLETNIFLRDIKNPVARSDRELMKVSKAMLLDLASADQIDEDKQPYVNAMIH